MMVARGLLPARQIWKNSARTGNEFSETRMHPLANLKERLIEHIFWMKKIENDCGITENTEAGQAFKRYDDLMPWLGLKQAVQERLNEIRPKG